MAVGLNLRDRCKFVLTSHGISVSEIAGGNGTALQAKVNRQINGDTTISYEVLQLLLEKFPDVSAEWLLRGEGPMERTKIYSPASHHQDIHVSEGGSASITQSGVAHLVVNDEPLGNEPLAALLVEKDELIAELKKNISVLKETIRILSSK